MDIFKVIVLAAIQGICELLPVSSSAHVIVAAKVMGIEPTSPEMTFLLVMLHTGTMFAVILYFWRSWMRNYFNSVASAWKIFRSLAIATIATAIVGGALMVLIERVLLRGQEHTEVEALFGNLKLISIALAAVGFLILAAGRRRQDEKKHDKLSPKHELTPRNSAFIGIVQGLCLPFRGFSRSGATISTALMLGLGRLEAENFSFALAVILTPPVIAREMFRLLKAHGNSAKSVNFTELFLPGVFGMICSLVAGLVALRILSSLLEKGHWKWFGYYCLFAAAAVLFINRTLA